MIIDILNQILSARYGRDVRQAIHDGIQQCYNDGKAGSIDLEARQGIQTLENEIAELQKFEVITETTSTTQPNSYAGRENILEIGGGESEQESTAGNQLLDYSGLSETTSNGITFTPIYDSNGNLEYINIKGTATANSIYAIGADRIHIQSGESYILSGAPSSASGTTCRMYLYNCDGNGKFIYDNGVGTEFVFSNESTNYNVAIIVYNGYTANNLKFYPMLRLASVTDATYEPYTGGIPAPNPFYPMEIKKSVVSGVRTYFAKGLVNPYTCVNGLLNTSGVLTTASTWVTSDYTEVKGGTKISVSTNTKVVRFAQYDENKNFIKNTSNIIGVTDSTYTPWTTTLESNTKYVRATFGLETNITPHELFKNHWIQIEEGEPTEFELYKESGHTFSQPIDLYGRNGVQDIFTAKQTKRRYGVAVFDGSDDEGWKYETATERMITSLLASKIKKPLNNGAKIKLLCSHFLNVTANATYLKKVGISVQSDSGTVHAYLGNDMTLAEWKAHLAEKPMTVVYELATPTTEALPIADQIGLNSLQTYDGITYVEFDSEIQPTFKAEYGTSKVGGYTLESLLTARNNDLRISALE